MIGHDFASARKRLGLSQTELGQILGRTQAQVSRYETDTKSIPPAIALAVEALERRCDMSSITIRNINGEYGDPVDVTAPTLAEAVSQMQAAVRACGADWSDVEITESDYEVVRERVALRRLDEWVHAEERRFAPGSETALLGEYRAKYPADAGQDQTTPTTAAAWWIGAYCALGAIDVAGADPTDCDGQDIIPTSPQQGDWDALDEFLGRDATKDEQWELQSGYGWVMDQR